MVVVLLVGVGRGSENVRVSGHGEMRPVCLVDSFLESEGGADRDCLYHHRDSKSWLCVGNFSRESHLFLLYRPSQVPRVDVAREGEVCGVPGFANGV